MVECLPTGGETASACAKGCPGLTVDLRPSVLHAGPVMPAQGVETRACSSFKCSNCSADELWPSTGASE